MRRAFLIAFFLGPVPFALWSTAVLRSTHPDIIALNFGSLLLTVPWLWVLIRWARRPMYLLCWFATGGSFFWAAVRKALGYASSPAKGIASVLLFPIAGYQAMLQDTLLLFPVCLFIYGVVSGFVEIRRRSWTPSIEREEKRPKRVKDEDDDEPEPPRPEPQFVPRPPPPKPKGPAYTPPTRVTPPPRPKRVPGI
ncbi:MAG: hypothetical protein K8T20_15530 [Planctomycetes bacterium]|nr:hypothetical protein [Planctomycetota bacterium]